MQRVIDEQREVRAKTAVPADQFRADTPDALDTAMFEPRIITPLPDSGRQQAESALPTTKVGVFPILQHLAENFVADIKFFTKLVARCSAGSAALCAYAKVPHLALVAALLNIGLSIVSDLCDKELRERQELATQARERVLLQRLDSEKLAPRPQ